MGTVVSWARVYAEELFQLHALSDTSWVCTNLPGIGHSPQVLPLQFWLQPVLVRLTPVHGTLRRKDCTYGEDVERKRIEPNNSC